MNFDPENPFQSSMNKSDARIIKLHFQSELYYKPPSNYHTISNSVYLRKQASLLIKKYAATGARDPVIPYLAMCYFDHYVSSHGIPPGPGLEIGNNRLPLFVTCFFIVAWKMRKRPFQLSEFLIHYKLPYLIDEIEDLEASIDTWLLHRHLDNIPILHRNIKRPVTAFCFLDYFINLLEKISENGKIYLKNLATHKLYALQYDMQYTEFKPSIVAAAAIAFCVEKYYAKAIKEGALDVFFTCTYLNTDIFKLAIERTVPGQKVEISDETLDDDNSVNNKARPQEKKRQQISAVSSSLAAAHTQSSETPAKMMTPPPDRSQGARADTRRMVMPPSDLIQGTLADARRMIERTGIDVEILPPPDQNSTLSSSLAAVLTQSVLDSLVPQSAPDHSPGARMSPSQITMSAPDHSPGACADTTRMMIPPPDRSQGALADDRRIISSTGIDVDITRMMMPPAHRSQGAHADTTRMMMPPADRSSVVSSSGADNRINTEMLPPPNRVPTRLRMTPSELPP